MDWTDAVILSLRALWDEGLSTAEIGRRLGVTKNAVVGKAHRLVLPARPSPIRRGGPGAVVARRSTGPTLPSMALPDRPLPGDGPAVQADAPVAPLPPVAAMRMPGPVAATAVVQAPAVPVAAAWQPVVSEEPPVLAQVVARAAPAARTAPALRPVSAPRRARVVACCWPIGEPGTRSFRFCDAESMAGKPYCDAHAQLAYVKVRERRDDAA